jgi:hypothetical protein
VSLVPGQSAILELKDQNQETRLVGIDDDVNAFRNVNFDVVIQYDETITDYCTTCFVNPQVGTQQGNQGVDHVKGGSRPGEFNIITSHDTDLWSADTAGKFLVTMVDWYPFRAVYVDPLTKALAKIDVLTIVPHDHGALTGGGPAGAVYT